MAEIYSFWPGSKSGQIKNSGQNVIGIGAMGGGKINIAGLIPPRALQKGIAYRFYMPLIRSGCKNPCYGAAITSIIVFYGSLKKRIWGRNDVMVVFSPVLL